MFLQFVVINLFFIKLDRKLVVRIYLFVIKGVMQLLFSFVLYRGFGGRTEIRPRWLLWGKFNRVPGLTRRVSRLLVRLTFKLWAVILV